MPRFLQQYPDVTLDLVADPAFADIVAQGFDAGVRLGEAVPRDMVAVRFGGESRMLTVASPAYLDGREPPQTPEGLADHRCVRSRTPNGRPYRWEFERDGHALSIDVPGQLILNRTELMAQAALAGAGIAFIPQRVAAPYLADSRLKAMLEDGSPAYPGLFLYYPGHRHVPPSLRAFINVIRATR
ncbi:LysR substrate-binding domain-containing protein [Rhizobium sp. BK376]|uniref:LysR substrate-binding domain-containing protein n=1 Tax=Rhizobium sp. BK376 TaxID=2512149 RepID=UPI0010E442A3|nr:LysR substrate-binding domain-containing protein [Rhizobium sp. BK376]TCR75583.1 LysR substrate binding domain-containing protein [Rhizobium sp. BK376]